MHIGVLKNSSRVILPWQLIANRASLFSYHILFFIKVLPLPSRITLFGLAKNPWNLFASDCRHEALDDRSMIHCRSPITDWRPLIINFKPLTSVTFSFCSFRLNNSQVLLKLMPSELHFCAPSQAVARF